jgi:xylulokinase
MLMNHLIGLDVGTTGVKGVLINENGKIVSSDFQDFPLLLPRPGWAEQHPDEWWSATVRTLQNLMAKVRIPLKSLKGLSLSGQMHGLVCLDEDARVIRPAILWCDQRTTAQCRSITRAVGPTQLIRMTCNPALEGFTLPKLQWVREHEPSHYMRIAKILLPKDYVRYRLTGIMGMEVSDAAGTLMFDVTKRTWSTALLKKLDIPLDFLPAVHESIDVAGELSSSAAKATGLPVGLPIVYGGADNTCAAVGNGIIEEGLVAVSIGTSGTVIAPTKSVRRDRLGRVHTFNHSVPMLWYLMGVMQAAGLSLKWYRDHFGAVEKAMAGYAGGDAYDYLSKEAEQAPAGSTGLIWLPYLQGERTPHLDANARGVLFGVTAHHTRAHVIRSVLEGVVYGLRDSLEIIRSMRVPIREIRLTGGGAKSRLWRQIQADVFDHEVVTINVDEGPAFGAAIIAGVGIGVFRTFKEAAERIIRVTDRIAPIRAHARLYDRYYRIYRTLYKQLKGSFAQVARIEG